MPANRLPSAGPGRGPAGAGTAETRCRIKGNHIAAAPLGVAAKTAERGVGAIRRLVDHKPKRPATGADGGLHERMAGRRAGVRETSRGL